MIGRATVGKRQAGPDAGEVVHEALPRQSSRSERLVTSLVDQEGRNKVLGASVVWCRVPESKSFRNIGKGRWNDLVTTDGVLLARRGSDSGEDTAKGHLTGLPRGLDPGALLNAVVAKVRAFRPADEVHQLREFTSAQGPEESLE